MKIKMWRRTFLDKLQRQKTLKKVLDSISSHGLRFCVCLDAAKIGTLKLIFGCCCYVAVQFTR
ncbi:unnamed protein product [Arabidopsis halleri]